MLQTAKKNILHDIENVLGLISSGKIIVPSNINIAFTANCYTSYTQVKINLVSSGPYILLKITLEWSINLKTI